MEPQIQYAKTSDGVNIAYYAIGAGDPLLVTPPLGPSHLSLERRFEPLAAWYRHVSAHRTLIRWDPRNTGMSDRKVENISEEAYDRDIEAVLRQVGLERVDIVASGPGTLTALGFAGRRAEAVRKLVVINALLRWAEYFPGHQGRAILALAEQDWTIFTETASHGRLGWSRRFSHEHAQFARESMLQEDFLRAMPSSLALDVSQVVMQIRADTMVIYSASSPFANMYLRAAREIASSVPKAKVLELRASGENWLTDPAIPEAVDEFLGIAPVTGTARGAELPSSMAVILFTDIVGHTEMMQRLGDDAGRGVLREHERITREALSAHGGTEVKTDGDSFMASFASVSAAVECAIALQRAFAQHSTNADEPIVIRIGLNVGEPIEEDGDYFGSAVILGARIKDQASGGEILVPEAVRHLLSGKSFLFSDRGLTDLKGFEDPVRLWEVRWGEKNAG